MIIDTHVHIHRGEPEKIVQSALRSGIDTILVSSIGIPGAIVYPTMEEIVTSNNNLIEQMKEFPDNIRGICFASPQHPDESAAEIERCFAQGIVGIKLWVAVKMSDPKVEPIARKAIELDIPILQHTWNKTTGNMQDESTPADVAVLAKKFPELRIQMAHLYGAGFHGIADIAPYPNIYPDVSGGEPEAGILEYAVSVLGPERILFGSDAPGRGFAVQLGKVKGANLSEEVKEMILWKNAKRVYKL